MHTYIAYIACVLVRRFNVWTSQVVGQLWKEFFTVTYIAISMTYFCIHTIWHYIHTIQSHFYIMTCAYEPAYIHFFIVQNFAIFIIYSFNDKKNLFKHTIKSHFNFLKCASEPACFACVLVRRFNVWTSQVVGSRGRNFLLLKLCDIYEYFCNKKSETPACDTIKFLYPEMCIRTSMLSFFYC